MTDTNTATDLVAKFSEYDFVFVVDKSGSMGEPAKSSKPDGLTRWQAAQESILALTREITKIDTDGIGLVLFSGDDEAGVVSYDGCGVDKVREAFASNRPSGGTPLAEALEAALKLAGKSDKKDFILVLTDGVPADKARAAKVIVEAANRQDSDDSLTILFLQVGDDSAATAYLQHLDDGLTGAKFDIVDTKTIAQADAYPSAVALIAAAIAD